MAKHRRRPQGALKEELHFLYLCTMHCPIDSKPNNILLEPICKNLLKRSLCVYVNNTEKDINYKEKDKKKFVAKRASILVP